MPTPPPLNFPTLGGRGPREEAVPEGLFWRPPGDSTSSGWHFVRPSRADRHAGRGRRRTTSLYDPAANGFPQSFQDGRRSNLHTSYNPDYADYARWNFAQTGLSPLDDPRYADYMRWQAEQRGVYPFDDPRYAAYAQYRAVASSTSLQETPYAVESQQEHYAFEHIRRNGHSRSVSAPQNSITYPNPGDNTATRYAHLPQHARDHPRFQEAVHAGKMIRKFGEGDPRAELYEKLLKEITEEMNEDNEEG